MQAIIKKFQLGQHEVTLETGAIARQACGAVLASIGDTSVLVTVVGKKDVKAGQDFFPLTVNYQERMYAAGRIPGGFLKREGRPNDGETLIARLIDRPIRPLFPDGFMNEVQVIATVMSSNPEIQPDIVTMIGTSAALAISGIPFNGPIGASRVGYVDGQYVLNPSVTELENSQLDLVVAGTDKAVLMVESEADVLPEDVMLGAVVYGHEQSQAIITAVNEFKIEAGKPTWDWTAPEKDVALADKIAAIAEEKIGAAYLITDKVARKDALNEAKSLVIDTLTAELAEDAKLDSQEVGKLFGSLEKNVVRGRIIAGEKRIDGRDPASVRALDVKTGVLSRTHGSSIFTRGETQAIVTTTLGTERDSQLIDDL